MVHDLDMVMQIAGEKPTHLSSFASSFIPRIDALDDFDNVVAALVFPSGVTAAIDINRRGAFGYDQRIEALGASGMLQAENAHATTVVHATESGVAQRPIETSFPTRYLAAYRGELECFVRCVAEGRNRTDHSRRRQNELPSRDGSRNRGARTARGGLRRNRRASSRHWARLRFEILAFVQTGPEQQRAHDTQAADCISWATCKRGLAQRIMEDDDVYRAIADPTRRLILDELNEREGQSLYELCTRLAMKHQVSSSRQAISQHLEILESAGLVVTRREGRSKFHWFDGTPLKAVVNRWPITKRKK